MRHAKPVRLKTAPTGGRESVFLFLEFTIIIDRGIFHGVQWRKTTVSALQLHYDVLYYILMCRNLVYSSP